MVNLSCGCTALHLCAEAERLHTELAQASQMRDSVATNLAYTRHRAPVSPQLRELLATLENRQAQP